MFGLMKRKQKQKQKQNSWNEAERGREIQSKKSTVNRLSSRVEKLESAYLEVGSLCESGNFKAAANAGGHSFGSSVSSVLESAASIFHNGDHIFENHRIKAKDATAEAGVICRRMIQKEKRDLEAEKRNLARLEGRSKR